MPFCVKLQIVKLHSKILLIFFAQKVLIHRFTSNKKIRPPLAHINYIYDMSLSTGQCPASLCHNKVDRQLLLSNGAWSLPGLHLYTGGLGLACLNTRLMTCVWMPEGRCSRVLSSTATQLGQRLFQPWPAPARSPFTCSSSPAPSWFHKTSQLLLLTRSKKQQWRLGLHKKNLLLEQTAPTWSTAVVPLATASLARTRLGP